MSHANVRYLEAKRTVDDRALSDRVRERLLAALPAAPTVLDAGCGTGAMLQRLHEWGVTAGRYHGVDRGAGVVEFAREDRPKILRRTGATVTEIESGFAVEELEATFETGDAFEQFSDRSGADLFVAAAFADLVPIGRLVDIAAQVLRPGGLAYFPITFDAGTVFIPDHPVDEAVEQAYHQAIDTNPGRDVRAGRRLTAMLQAREGDLVAMDASDWVVRPMENGYPTDEAAFLDTILRFVEDALADEGIEGFEDWLATRRGQLAASQLTYVAHQYDLLYRTPEP
ncbi:class I SAM-dependent methyltransferase [Halolamina sp.]|jgi:SAM-dependent methyltransferase|uniref:class I SAM-dependent methyltransferase n=1 Tax=Halolamina sp. TaxID=1940283 RepID=UPI0035615FBC